MNGRRIKILLKSAPFMIRSHFFETQCIRVFGEVYVIRSNTRKIGVDGRIYAEREDYSQEIGRAIRKFANNDSMFIDIGANTGFFTRMWQSTVNSKSHSFEPDPTTFSYLQQNCTEGALYNLALSDSDGSMCFEVRADFGSSGLVEDNGRNLPKVQVQRLDSLAKDANNFLLKDAREASNVIMKIDIEGFEPASILGMSEFISEFRPVLVCEWKYHDRVDPRKRFEAIQLLKTKEYRFFDVHFRGNVELDNFAGDFIAVPPQLGAQQ